MAIGGSITDTTQASTRKQPSTSSPWSQAGAWSATKSWCSCSSTQNRKVGQPLGRNIRPSDGDPKHQCQEQQHHRIAGALAGQDAIQLPIHAVTAVPLVCNHLTADALRLCHQTGHHRILQLAPGGQPCLPQLDVGVGQGGFQRQCVETVHPQLRLAGSGTVRRPASSRFSASHRG